MKKKKKMIKVVKKKINIQSKCPIKNQVVI